MVVYACPFEVYEEVMMVLTTEDVAYVVVYEEVEREVDPPVVTGVVELLPPMTCPPPLFKIPPTAPPEKLTVVAFFASKAKAARVLPVAGALMAATIPLWQWLPTVCPQ